jgi:ABC-type polysaccharide/polyol phosphate export permease
LAESPTFARVAAAFLRRDLRVARSYRLSFVVRVASVLVAIASFGALARFLGGGGAAAASVPGGYLGFWVVGLALAELFHVSLSAWSTRVRQAQLEGTLEAVLSTAAPASHVVLASGLYDLLAGLGRLAVYLVAGMLVFDVDFSRADPAAAALTFALALCTFVGLGVLGGALTMVLRRTDPISAFAWLGAATLGGVFYPVDSLPAWAHTLSYLLPIAPALTALRAALFQGAGVAELGRPLAALALFAALVWPLAALAFRHAVARARDDGSLSQY